MKFAQSVSGAMALAALVISIPEGASAVTETKLTSRYVSLKETDCTVIDKNEDEDWSVQRCGAAVGGWAVQLDYGDARESITFVDKSREYPMEFFRFGGGFSSLGPTFEFRLRRNVPVAAVGRYSHVIDENDNERSELVVMRVSPKPCVVAMVPPGPSQSSRARTIADSIDSQRRLVAS
jgi:hypothetical protein